ncbi:ImmA/IrrE family metallo-endopeptidase [Enterococcus raffinosus]|uniref:ImmA/IrrE family metallo-endopeptidase n=1 Tax=Enterococcus raffinosus TaxID=71452 RepID=UPI00288C91A5|nr:ImmA/IrrE family metallo-endopeptidase [Enterococcus raffinosus]MDT2554747.1 ImmA/IrrE family metallo-endopeptidase [Enterococcus raffinosus]
MSLALDEYRRFSAKVNEYLSATMLGLDMNVNNYNHDVIWESITEGKVAIRGFGFEGKARQSISGMIVKDNYETTITYNRNMNPYRINFTISHELMHFLYHLNDDTPYYYDTKDSLKNYNSKSLVEFQANVGAAATLLPDPVLIHVLKQGEHPAAISNQFGISEKALKRRLIQTMQSEFNASYNAAIKTSFKIFDQYGNSGQTLMRDLGNNLERKIIYSNPFYEALCI